MKEIGSENKTGTCCCAGTSPGQGNCVGGRQRLFWALVVGCVLAVPVGWLLALLILLPGMLGLFFYMLFGLLVGAFVFRVASPLIPVPRRTAIALGAVVTLAMAHARRLCEEGRHVVVLLDSLTRLARVQNLAAPGGGKTLSGGMDASALTPLRQVFGAARAIEEGGSLTLIATCLIDTNSRLDQVVYEEFKGTGNMEVHLDRKLAQLGLYPAVSLRRSSTRQEALLLDDATLEGMTRARRALARMGDEEALAILLEALRVFPDNALALERLLD